MRQPHDLAAVRVVFARSLAAFSLLIFLGMHCNRSLRSPATRSLDDFARSYCRLALALAERDPDSLDFYIGPKEVLDEVHASYPTLDQTLRESLTLTHELEHAQAHTDAETQRIRFLLAQLTAIQTRVAMLRGAHFDFDTESHLLFNTERLPDEDAPARRIALIAISQELPGKHSQTLADRYAAFGQQFIIPRDRVPQVMQAALAACRNRTLEHIAFPRGEKITVEYVHNKLWNAFSHYRGLAQSTIEINTDFPLTVDRALELACHEGYPGHHVFNTLRDAVLVQKNAWPEAQVQLTFSPQSFLSEAAAAYAPQLAFSPEERTRIERDVLFPLAGLPANDAARYVSVTHSVDSLDSALPWIAREYLDGRLEFVRTEQRLEDEALMEHSEETLLYLNEYRTYMLAYTDGRRRIEAYLGRTAGDARWAQYQKLMTSPAAPKELSDNKLP